MERRTKLGMVYIPLLLMTNSWNRVRRPTTKGITCSRNCLLSCASRCACSTIYKKTCLFRRRDVMTSTRQGPTSRDLAPKLMLCLEFQRLFFLIWIGTSNVQTCVYSGFPNFRQRNAAIVNQIGTRLLPSTSIPFIICHSTLRNK